jgi:6-pyruvoyltetrahydropterin/6-carboxytetrahydropterin synthase
MIDEVLPLAASHQPTTNHQNARSRKRLTTMESYRVRISEDGLVFSAAHFIVIEGDTHERLHGHDFRVTAEVHGPLDDNGYVVDFLALRESLEAILEELDHRVLLPTEHPTLRIRTDVEHIDAEHVEVTAAECRWVFPRGDCVLLPMVNTSAELLGRWIARRLLDRLHERTGSRPTVVRIEVTESRGQSGLCELREE